MKGKLQVELAQLKYLSTRLVRGWSHLERQKVVLVCVGQVKNNLSRIDVLLRQRIKQLSKRLDKLTSAT